MRPLVREAGQRLMIGFDGHEPSAELRTLIREHGIGGVILFTRNVAEPSQLAELVRELQSLARDAGHELPLLVGIDQEGGRVSRLQGEWTAWPPLRAVGRIASEEVARRLGGALGEQLRPCGIHVDFAPVVDVDSNPKNPVIGDRSLGSDPAQVALLSAALIRGIQETGVAACAKHFPGHGDTSVDSHVDLPVLDHPRARLDEVELPPFRSAIAVGVAAVMTAHLLVREIDDRLPATLSPAIVEDILRRSLGFSGVIVSDDLEMKAIAKQWSSTRAAPLAALAGCDLLLVCHTHDAQAAAHEALVRAVEDDTLPRQAFEDSVMRIRRLKERFAAPVPGADPAAARAAATDAAHQRLAADIARRSGLDA